MRILSYFFIFMLFTTTAFFASEPQFSFSGGTGAVLRLSNVEARCYTSFSDNSSVSGLCKEARYGGALFLLQKTHPVTIKAGMLSFGASLSRLSTPAPSASVSPLAKTFTTKTGLQSTLPTLSSASQPLALAFCASLSPETESLVIEGAAKEDSTCFFSLHARKALSRHTKISWAFTAARFYLESSATLTAFGAGFSSGWYKAALSETSFSSPFLSFRLQGAVHETPYEKSAFWLYGALRACYQSFLLDAGAFFLPCVDEQPKASPLIGGSSNVCRVRSQLNIRPQVQLVTADSFGIRAGFEILWQERITATKYADLYTTNKIATGIAFESVPLTAKFTAAGVNVHTAGAFHTASSIPETYYDAACSMSLVYPVVKASLTLDAKNYPVQPLKSSSVEKNVYTARVAVSPGKAREITVRSGWTGTWKAGERTSGEATCAVCIKKHIGSLRLAFTGTLSLSF